jgi:hypothetical protein
MALTVGMSSHDPRARGLTQRFDGGFGDWRRRRAARRVKPGTGRALKPFRWWQSLSRSLLYLRLTTRAGERVEYAIEVRHGGDPQTGEIMAQLYRNGTHIAQSKTPAAFPVEGGTIRVATSTFGLKRCDFVADDGRVQQLVPDPHSAEGRRTSLDRRHPALSRGIGVVTLTVAILGLLLLIPQLIESLSQIPPIAQNIGTFTSPIQLSAWQNVAVTLVTGAASTERALRLRYHWLLDGITE